MNSAASIKEKYANHPQLPLLLNMHYYCAKDNSILEPQKSSLPTVPDLGLLGIPLPGSAPLPPLLSFQHSFFLNLGFTHFPTNVLFFSRIQSRIPPYT